MTQEHQYVGTPDSLRGLLIEEGATWRCTSDGEVYVRTGSLWIGTNSIRSEAGYLIVPDSEDLQPEEIPTSTQVFSILLHEFERCIKEDALFELRSEADEVVQGSGEVFERSVMYANPDMRNFTQFLQGYEPTRQILGKILHDDEVMSLFVNDVNNCLVTQESMRDTYLTHLPEAESLCVTHRIPDSPLLRRYIRRFFSDRTSVRTVCDIMSLDVNFPYSDVDSSELLNIIRNLRSILGVYYKLLTRFPTCQSYSRDLPSFQTS